LSTCIALQVTDTIVDLAAADAGTIAELEVPGTCYLELLRLVPNEALIGRQCYREHCIHHFLSALSTISLPNHMHICMTSSYR